MNQTKQTLIRVSAIISIIEGASTFLYSLVSLSAFSGVGYVLLGVFSLLLGVCGVAGGALLLSNKGDRRSYIAGCTLVIIGAGGLSICAILLYIAFSIQDKPYVVVQPEPQPQNDAKIKEKMELLRQMRANGEITEEEFKQMMFELIKK